MFPQDIQWTILTKPYQALWKIPLVLKGLSRYGIQMNVLYRTTPNTAGNKFAEIVCFNDCIKGNLERIELIFVLSFLI